MRLKIELFLAVSLVLSGVLVVSCVPSQSFNARLNSIVKPYYFSIAKWEFNTIVTKTKQVFSGKDKKIDDEINKVTEYFSTTERSKIIKAEIKAVTDGKKPGDLASLEVEFKELQQQKIALGSVVEGIIKKQIKEILAEQGIFNPIDKYLRLKVSFPPVNFKLERPPHLLIISPRDRIESMREIVLRQELNVAETEAIEAKVDELNVSSLVVELGGFGGTYPTFVTNEASLRFTIDTATEEWLHQYLAFKPLGFLYLLDLVGIARNYEIVTINETLASIVSKEIGSLLLEKYYPREKNKDNDREAKAMVADFDFNREMREIRRAVAQFLAQGEIKPAEEFMEQKRQYLATKGYQMRKLNQAYFAFHDAYADRPTSISPIGVELRRLRSQSASLKDFLETVAAVTSHQDLVLRIQ